MKYTLDTNCIIDLEEERPDLVHLEKIVDTWRTGKIKLAVVAISASENQPAGKVNEGFEVFMKKLEAVGLQGVEIILPMFYWDIGQEFCA